MKKIYQYVVVAVAVILGASSCEKFLDRPAEDVYNESNFYQNDVQCITLRGTTLSAVSTK